MKIKNLTRGIFQKKGLLIVELQEQSLLLGYFRKKETPVYEKWTLREVPEDMISNRIQTFLKNRSFSQSCLVIPRSEVLQKELVFSGSERGPGFLEKKIREILPYDAHPMAYGIALDETAGEQSGLFIAVPEKQIASKLSFMERLGLSIDEVITEDQALAWLAAEKPFSGTLLALEQNEHRVLALLLRNGRMIFSRSFAKTSQSFAYSDFFQEISLALLGLGPQAEKILLLGAWNAQAEIQIRNHFLLPAEFPHDASSVKGSPAAYGARLFCERPVISLLPHPRKIAKWKGSQKALFKDCLFSAAFFSSALILSFLIHLSMQQIKINRLDREASQIALQAWDLKKSAGLLDLEKQTQQSKEILLGFLRDLNSKMPASLTLREIRIEDGRFYFKGEASSHAAVTETVQALEAVQPVHHPKLENTRLRKKLNQDFYEFEITGQWKI